MFRITYREEMGKKKIHRKIREKKQEENLVSAEFGQWQN